MLAKIAAFTEAHRPHTSFDRFDVTSACQPTTAAEAMASVVAHALESVPCAAVFVPTATGDTPRMLSRLNPATWIVAVSRDAAVCQGLTFSSGVHPVHVTWQPERWRDFIQEWIREHQIPGALAMLAAGPSAHHPDDNHRLELLRL